MIDIAIQLTTLQKEKRETRHIMRPTEVYRIGKDEVKSTRDNWYNIHFFFSPRSGNSGLKNTRVALWYDVTMGPPKTEAKTTLIENFANQKNTQHYQVSLYLVGIQFVAYVMKGVCAEMEMELYNSSRLQGQVFTI